MTTRAIYWGAGGEYGPFSEQQQGAWAGWPDFGQVVHYFRKKAGLTAKEFGMLYGKLVNSDGSAISERHILRMELDNKVPVDMNRRKIIVDALHIPPMLLGLATLEDIHILPCSQGDTARATGQTTLQKVTVDTNNYQDTLRTLWALHDTSQAQSALKQITVDVRDLETLEQQCKGDLLYYIQELLLSYHLLAAHIVRDKRQFSVSHHHANEAVRVARSINDSELLATALYTRGCTNLEWGMFGTLKRGIFQVQQEKIKAAIRDFERALAPNEERKGGKTSFGRTEKQLHPQLLGRITLHLSRAYSILSISMGVQAPASALVMLDEVSGTVDRQSIHDTYTRVLMTGERVSFTKGGYHSARAAGFAAARMPGIALQELNVLEGLQQKVGQDLTRRHVWLDIIAANTYIALQQYEEATNSAIKALSASHDIKSITNLINIVNIHGQLLNSSYRTDTDVRELGDLLKEVLTTHIERKE